MPPMPPLAGPRREGIWGTARPGYGVERAFGPFWGGGGEEGECVGEAKGPRVRPRKVEGYPSRGERERHGIRSRGLESAPNEFDRLDNAGADGHMGICVAAGLGRGGKKTRR